MADDRPADSDLAAVVADMQLRYDDQISTLLTRASRCPTGTVLSGFWKIAPPDTVFLQGQALSRDTYAVLWQWVQDQGLVGSGFGAGDGSTTFTVPDCRGRAMTGATTDRPVGTLYGAATRVILPENMAAHTHQVSVDAHGDHGHGIDVGSDVRSHTHGFGTTGVGDHGFHRPYDAGAANTGPVNAAYANTTHEGRGAHGHSGTTGNATGAHEHYATVFAGSAGGHTVRQVAVGTNTPFNVESPSFAGSWIIYC